MVLLSALASIELHGPRQPLLPADSHVIQVPADGLCFWHALRLAVGVNPSQLYAWTLKPRNAQGFPSSADYKHEQNDTMLWALDLPRLTGTPMTPETKSRIHHSRTAEGTDIATWCNFLELKQSWKCRWVLYVWNTSRVRITYHLPIQ